MENKWQILIAECEKLSDLSGVPVPISIHPPAEGPVGLEWADPWIRESRRLDWLTGFLRDANASLQKRAALDAEAANVLAADPKKTTRRLDI